MFILRMGSEDFLFLYETAFSTEIRSVHFYKHIRSSSFLKTYTLAGLARNSSTASV